MIAFLLLLLCVLIFSGTDVVATRWAKDGGLLPLLLCLALGPTGYLLFGQLAARTSLAQSGAYVNAGIVLATVLAAVIWQGERPDLRSWIGLGLVLAGLLVLSGGKVQAA